MSWKEFSILLGGLGSTTPLVKVVSIRSEDDPKVIKEFTPEQKRMRNEWRRRQLQKKPLEEQRRMVANITQAVVNMVGGNNGKG